MGIPREDWDWLYELTRRTFGAEDAEYQLAGSARGTAAEAHSDLLLYFGELVEERRSEFGGDVVSALAQATVEGCPLDDEDVLMNCDTILAAGDETARHAAATGLVAFIEHPEQWRLVREHPEAIDTAVEEVLRWSSPGMHVLRTATRDVEVAGELIRRGETVTVWNPSANRDERAFEAPERFDVGRSPNRHLAFGVGEHFCLGASLARMELRVLFEELTRRVAEVEVVAPVERLRSNLIGGLKRLPVRLHGA
jgi:cytochrome P450